MISVENTDATTMNTKKKKRPPQRRCGDWCEFLSSKGKLYYFQIKKGYTQWSKPDSWDDNQAYEPISKRRPEEEKPAQEEFTIKAADPWSSSMTSLKAKIQLKLDMKKMQKKRRDKVLDQLSQIDGDKSKEQKKN